MKTNMPKYIRLLASPQLDTTEVHRLSENSLTEMDEDNSLENTL